MSLEAVLIFGAISFVAGAVAYHFFAAKHAIAAARIDGAVGGLGTRIYNLEKMLAGMVHHQAQPVALNGTVRPLAPPFDPAAPTPPPVKEAA